MLAQSCNFENWPAKRLRNSDELCSACCAAPRSAAVTRRSCASALPDRRPVTGDRLARRFASRPIAQLHIVLREHDRVSSLVRRPMNQSMPPVSVWLRLAAGFSTSTSRVSPAIARAAGIASRPHVRGVIKSAARPAGRRPVRRGSAVRSVASPGSKLEGAAEPHVILERDATRVSFALRNRLANQSEADTRFLQP